MVIGDSWFGSFKCANALKAHGLYAILCVKTAHRQFPLATIKSMVPHMGLAYHMVVDCKQGGREYAVYATAHKDKKPLTLVHTCGGA